MFLMVKIGRLEGSLPGLGKAGFYFLTEYFTNIIKGCI